MSEGVFSLCCNLLTLSLIWCRETGESLCAGRGYLLPPTTCVAGSFSSEAAALLSLTALHMYFFAEVSACMCPSILLQFRLTRREAWAGKWKNTRKIWTGGVG